MNEDLANELYDANDNAIIAADTLRAAHENFAEKYGHFPININLSPSDYTLADVLTAVSSLTALVRGFAIKDGGPYVPRNLIETLRDRLREATTAIDLARTQFDNVESYGGLSSFDEASFIASTINGNAINLSKQIRNALIRVDVAYAAWYQLRTVSRTPQLREFSKLASLSEAQNAEISNLQKQAAKKNKSIEVIVDEMTQWRNIADETAVEIDRILKAVQTERRTIDENAAIATAKIAELKVLESTASELSGTVKAYQTSFDVFDNELEERTTAFTEQQNEYNSLRQKLIDETENAVGLITQAENLLKGATNIGLAASFSQIQIKTDRELSSARRSFYFSITLLVVLTLPIALYVFPGLQILLKELTGLSIENLTPKALTEHSTFETVAQIAARALLLVPGIWLVRFTAARHERLFRLREHYAYKYSVASSVEGFKQQAPDMKDAIAAAAFFELTFNPATRMDANSVESRYPNPIMDWVMKKLQSKNDEKMSS